MKMSSHAAGAAEAVSISASMLPACPSSPQEVARDAECDGMQVAKHR